MTKNNYCEKVVEKCFHTLTKKEFEIIFKAIC